MDWTMIGTRIRAKREEMGYSRERLAELLEITPKFCSDIELGVKGMSIPTLCRISGELRLTTDYILFGSEETSPASLMVNRCPKEKYRQLETIIGAYLDALK